MVSDATTVNRRTTMSPTTLVLEGPRQPQSNSSRTMPCPPWSARKKQMESVDNCKALEELQMARTQDKNSRLGLLFWPRSTRSSPSSQHWRKSGAQVLLNGLEAARRLPRAEVVRLLPLVTSVLATPISFFVVSIFFPI